LRDSSREFWAIIKYLWTLFSIVWLLWQNPSGHTGSFAPLQVLKMVKYVCFKILQCGSTYIVKCRFLRQFQIVRVPQSFILSCVTMENEEINFRLSDSECLNYIDDVYQLTKFLVDLNLNIKRLHGHCKKDCIDDLPCGIALLQLKEQIFSLVLVWEVLVASQNLNRSEVLKLRRVCSIKISEAEKMTASTEKVVNAFKRRRCSEKY